MMPDKENAATDKPPSELDMLCGVIANLFPERTRPRPRRRINIRNDRDLGVDELELATSALADAASDSYVDVEVALKLLGAIEKPGWAGIDVDTFRARVISHVERRWPSFVEALVEHALETYQPSSVFSNFPKLRSEHSLVTRLAASLAARQGYAHRLEEVLDQIAPKALAEARLLVAALLERGSRDERGLATSLFCALGRGMGWTPWVSLQAILHVRPDYVGLHATFERDGDRSKESQTTIDRRLEMAREIKAHAKVRDVAGLLLELIGHGNSWRDDGLLGRPAETRAAFVDSLRATIGNDPNSGRRLLRRCFGPQVAVNRRAILTP